MKDDNNAATLKAAQGGVTEAMAIADWLVASCGTGIPLTWEQREKLLELQAALSAQQQGPCDPEKCHSIQENRDYWYGVAEQYRQELYGAKQALAPSPARTIYDHRVRVDEACRDAAPRLYSALKNLLDAVKERPDNMGIESVVTGDAENALLAASPARGDDDAAARKLYNDSQRNVHNLHTLAWSELPEDRRNHWREKAKKDTRP